MSVALLEYLQVQQGITFKKLYQQPSTSLAVLRRMLPHLAKTIVMAMLFMSEPFLEEDLNTWIRADARAQRDEAISVLEQLHIISFVPEPPIPRAYRLHPSFARSLRQALMGGGSTESFGVPATKRSGPDVTIEELDTWARGQWESILYYMVGSTGAGGLSQASNIAPGTRNLLEAGEFVVIRRGTPAITKDGFEFLLQEPNAQVWNLLIVYLENSKSLEMDAVEVLSFLFMLGSLTLGQDYSTESLTETQVIMLQDLHDFGIVHQPPKDPNRFYPTRLATTLTSSDSASTLLDDPKSSISSQNGAGYIILETNHRLYAYTNSPLQIAVLQLFARLTNRFPNLVSGKLTKESVQTAISYGITSDQIIKYLSTHAHPQMLKNNPILPPTVVDQIRLWQIEGDRMRANNGFLLKQFDSKAEYQDCLRYAENLGVLVWNNESLQMFFVTRIEQLQAFLKKRSQQAQQGSSKSSNRNAA